MKRMNGARQRAPLPPRSWIARTSRRVLPAVAVVCALGVTGAMHHEPRTLLMSVDVSEPVAARVEATVATLATVATPELIDEVQVVADVPVVEAVVVPASRPVLRGVYTGAAKTALESGGRARMVWLEVTGYCPCEKCCGPMAAGVTASGKPVSYHDGVFAAADPAVLPFGTKVRVPGYHDGVTAEVVDKGSAIVGPKLDVFFPTHAQAEEWGRQWLAVRVERE